jgi:hypothetical protein
VASIQTEKRVMKPIVSSTLLISAWVAAQPAFAQEYIAGLSARQTWTDLRRSNRYAIEWNWFEGYVEALLLNDKRLTPHGNEINPLYIARWTDNCCQQNPSKILREAARDFHASQVERFKPPPQK